jgi:multiple inositol-polyphosphate phosphatase/2,3-bisphosphoglycerate 3-phosphatase
MGGHVMQVNYGIAAPLLSDIASALTAAATSHSAGNQPLQRVRLHFAHCETLTPLASLLGLFKPGAEEQRAMPEVPSGRALKSTVKISPEQVRVHRLAACCCWFGPWGMGAAGHL